MKQQISMLGNHKMRVVTESDPSQQLVLPDNCGLFFATAFTFTFNLSESNSAKTDRRPRLPPLSLCI